MQSFLVVYVLNEAVQMALRLALGLIIGQVRLVLQRAEEALRPGVLPRRARFGMVDPAPRTLTLRQRAAAG